MKTLILILEFIVCLRFTATIYAEPAPPPSSRSLPLEKLLEKTPEEIGKMDIAELNLICSDGLPGSEKLDVPAKQALLDAWAQKCQKEIDRNYHRFRDNPGEYLNSEGFFKMVMMILTLQQDMNAHYNPTMIGPVALLENPDQQDVEKDLADDSYFKDSKDVFITGLLSDSRMGTCSSLPVLYLAVGRRLGFPLKLVLAKGHCFVRWEDEKERFNIEGSGQGVDTHPDDYYQKWPLPIAQSEIDAGQYLKSLTPTEELGCFLEERSDCLIANNRIPEALLAQAQASRYLPKSVNLGIGLAKSAEVVTAGVEPRPQAAAPEPPPDLDEINRLNQQTAQKLQSKKPGNLSRPTPSGR